MGLFVIRMPKTTVSVVSDYRIRLEVFELLNMAAFFGDHLVIEPTAAKGKA